jgi:hypothetical protein
MHRFELPFSSATTSLLSREDLIHACTFYEPTYSPDASVTSNDISYCSLQHQLQINETLVSTVAALIESAFPPGASIDGPLPVRLKLLTTGLTSTRCLDLSVTCALALSSSFPLLTLIQNLSGTAFEAIGGVPSTSTHVRLSPCILLKNFASRASVQGTALKPNFPITASSALIQREIAKAMLKVANGPPGTRVKRVAISNTDPHDAGTHLFTVFFEITNFG